MSKFDYFIRSNHGDEWALIAEADVPEMVKPRIERGINVTTKDAPVRSYRACPRLPTSGEIVKAAHLISKRLTEARKNGDWFHPATQLLIESAHNDFLALFDLPIPPPIVGDPTLRKRWRPRP